MTGIISRKSILYGLLYIAFILCLTIWVFVTWDNRPIGDYREVTFIWVAASFIVNTVGLLLVKKIDYAHIGLWFVLLSYLFMFGHVLTYVFDMDTTLAWNPAPVFDEPSKYKATAYAILSITLIAFGCYVATPSASRLGSIKQKKDDNKSAMMRTGVICLIVGGTCSLINASNVISAAQSSGAYSIYMAAESSGLVDDFAFLLVPSVILLLFSGVLKRGAAAALVVFVLTFYILTMTLSGSRKMAIFAIVVVIIGYIKSGKHLKLSIPQILALGILCLLLLNLIYTIREYREDINSVLPKFLSSLTSLEFLRNLLSETLTETGLTFYSVAGIVQAVPRVFPYEMGMTIVRTLPSILPIGWLVGDFFNNAASTYVINTYFDVPVGASLIGDFYWNWGLIGGCVASCVFGIGISQLYGRCSESRLGVSLYLSAFYIILVGVRAGIFEIFRPLIISTAMPLLLFVLLNNKNRGKRGIK